MHDVHPMQEIDSQVRRADEDRWLASRFASADVRAKLIALYAVNYEIARTGDVVREPGLGLIRLQWWRDALADEARQSDHPALAALKAAGAWSRSAALLQAAADARRNEFDHQPFADWAAVEAYVDATAGGLMRAAFALCGADDSAALAEPGGRAWGYAGLLRIAPHWRAKGRAPTPGAGADDKGLRDRARSALDKLAALAPAAPAPAFPAFGYVTLARDYIQAREPPLFVRQLRLIYAAARGRI